MRAAIIATLILLLPAVVLANPTVGVYFGGGSMTKGGLMPYEPFDAFVYGHAINCYLSAVEFQVVLPPGPHGGLALIGWEVAGAPNTVVIGNPLDGIGLAFTPRPLDGYDPGWNLFVTLHLLAMDWCECSMPPGALIDAPLRIVPHPESGHIYGTCWPEHYKFDFVGLTSIICPYQIATQEKSWGAIKSLF